MPRSKKELNTCERKGLNATNITSAFAESCVQFPWPMMSILMRMLCLCLALMNFLDSIKTTLCRVGRLSYEALAFS